MLNIFAQCLTYRISRDQCVAHVRVRQRPARRRTALRRSAQRAAAGTYHCDLLASDGICAWQCCIEQDGPQTESIEVDGSHCGLGHHPAAIYAIADRMAQPEGTWKPFDRSGWRSLIYPDPRRPQ
jgi:hypothetical protein